MNCRTCGAAARDGQRFCEACGTALDKKCAGCGSSAPYAARFCGTCGSNFGDEAPAPGSTAIATGNGGAALDIGAGERRQLTVLFADMVGSTALSGRLDPEALRTLLRAYQQVCVECAERYGGNIHQYAGDGVLAYFGYPVAHDHDAERAVLAGMDIVQGTQRLAAELRQRGESDVAVRIGVHTGMVVVGEMGAGGAREVHAIGETPNVAARIQGEAAVDSVYVSAATRRLLRPHFQARSIGVRALKGVARAIELFTVDAVTSELEPAQRAAPLIGREKELAHLEEHWALARSGQGQAVLISGEGGIGKSRLLAAFRERASSEAAWRTLYCSPFYQNSALHPMIDLIERGIGRGSGDMPTDRAAALRRMLDGVGLGDDMSFALIASLVGLGAEQAVALEGLAPDQRKRRTLDALIAWVHADALLNPLVVVFEDLHWIDASTRELLGTLLERIADMPILVLLTFRPEFIPTWALHGQISTLPLARLSAAQSALLAQGVFDLPPGEPASEEGAQIG